MNKMRYAMKRIINVLFVGILTGFKTLSVGYSEDKGTTLPGFLPEARWLGQQSYNGSEQVGYKAQLRTEP